MEGASSIDNSLRKMTRKDPHILHLTLLRCRLRRLESKVGPMFRSSTLSDSHRPHLRRRWSLRNILTKIINSQSLFNSKTKRTSHQLLTPLMQTRTQTRRLNSHLISSNRSSVKTGPATIVCLEIHQSLMRRIFTKTCTTHDSRTDLFLHSDSQATGAELASPASNNSRSSFLNTTHISLLLKWRDMA